MADIFLKVLNMSISASWLILAVVLLRLVLKKAPRWVNPLLWGIVALRLIMPFSIESVLSLIPSAETVSTQMVEVGTPAGNVTQVIQPVFNSGVSAIDRAVAPVFNETFTPEAVVSADPLQIVSAIASAIWLFGIAAMLIYAIASSMSLRNRVSRAVQFEENVYVSDQVPSPFVMGIFRPRIYLPCGMDEEDIQLVLAHERAHIARRDTWIKPLGFAILCLHWFNPLVWLAWVLFCRDIEYACDESVVKSLDRESRADYSQALLNCQNRKRIAVFSPLAFGEARVGSRVKRVLNYKKPALWIAVCAIVAAIVLAVCFLTNPVSGNQGFNPNEIPYTDKAGESPADVLFEARRYAAGEANRLVELGIDIESARVSDITERDANHSGTDTEGRQYRLTFYAVDYTLSGTDMQLDEAPEGYVLDGIDLNPESTTYLLFKAVDGGYEYISAVRESEIEAEYLPTEDTEPFNYFARYMYAEYVHERYSFTASDIVVDSSIGNTVPVQVLDLVTEMVASTAENGSIIGPEGNLYGPYAVTEIEIVDLTPHVTNAGGVTESGQEYTLTFYALRYRCRIEPTGCLVPDMYTLDGDYITTDKPTYLLFYERGGEHTYIGGISGTIYETDEEFDSCAADLFESYSYSMYYSAASFTPPDGLTVGEYELGFGYCGGWSLLPQAYEAYDTYLSDSQNDSYSTASGSVLTVSGGAFIHDASGNITGVDMLWMHASFEGGESYDGLQYPAYITHTYFDLYTNGEYTYLQAKGITPEYVQSEYWTVFLARPEDEIGYMLSLDARQFSREDAIAFAATFRFPDEANGITADSVEVSFDPGDGFPANVLSAAKEYVASVANSVDGVTRAQITSMGVVNAGASGTLQGGEDYTLDFFYVDWWLEAGDGVVREYTGADTTYLLFRRSASGDIWICATTQSEIEAIGREYAGLYDNEYEAAARQLYAESLGYSAREIDGFTWQDVEFEASVPELPEAVQALIASEVASYANSVQAMGLSGSTGSEFNVSSAFVSEVVVHPVNLTPDEGELSFYEFRYGCVLDAQQGVEITGYIREGERLYVDNNPCLLVLETDGDCELIYRTNWHEIDTNWSSVGFIAQYGDAWNAAAAITYDNYLTRKSSLDAQNVEIGAGVSAGASVLSAAREYVAAMAAASSANIEGAQIDALDLRATVQAEGPDGNEHSVECYYLACSFDTAGDTTAQPELLMGVYNDSTGFFAGTMYYSDFVQNYSSDYAAAARAILSSDTAGVAGASNASVQVYPTGVPGAAVKSDFTQEQFDELWTRVRDSYDYSGEDGYTVTFRDTSPLYDISESYNVTTGDPDYGFVDGLYLGA